MDRRSDMFQKKTQKKLLPTWVAFCHSSERIRQSVIAEIYVKLQQFELHRSIFSFNLNLLINCVCFLV